MTLGNKEVFAENLKYYMEKHSIDRNKLCSDLNFKYMTVSDWINAKTYPRIDKIEILSNYFGIRKSNLVEKNHNEKGNLIEKILSTSNQLDEPRQHNVLNYAENQLDEQNGIVKLSGYIKEDIPEYTTSGLYGALSAGTGQQIFDNPIEEVEIPTSIIPNEPYDIMLKIVGDSMQPAFKDGEYVFIKLTKDIRSGQFAAIIVDGEAYLKKVYIDDDCLRLVSLNKGYEDIIVDDISNVEIVGTVVL